MRKCIYYAQYPLNIADLLIMEGVSVRKDFSERQRKRMKLRLEKYLKNRKNKDIRVNMKKFILIIGGVDEVAMLYWCLNV